MHQGHTERGAVVVEVDDEVTRVEEAAVRWVSKSLDTKEMMVRTITAPTVYTRLKPKAGHMMMPAMLMRPKRDLVVSSAPAAANCIANVLDQEKLTLYVQEMFYAI